MGKITPRERSWVAVVGDATAPTRYGAGMRSIFASPGDEYLRLVGEMAYSVTSIEGGLIYDVPRLSSVLPEGFTVGSLVGGTTAGIGQQFLDAAPKVQDLGVRRYFEVGGQALREAGAIRNDVLHARPATHPVEDQRLHRSTPSGQSFFIDDAWLHTALVRLAVLAREVDSVRPAFGDWP